MQPAQARHDILILLLVFAVGCADEDPSNSPGSELDRASCYSAPYYTSCEAPGPAPQSSADIGRFVTNVARPLACGEDLWDLRVLTSLAADSRIFMMGEIHGSNEMGLVSRRLFDNAVRQLGFNVLAYEIPSDFEADLQDFVDDGDNFIIESLLADSTDNVFVNILTRQAFELAAESYDIRIGAVDAPWGTEQATASIIEIAQQLSPAVASLVLDTLPAPRVYFEATTSTDIAEANAYDADMFSHLAEVCAELSAEDCERFEIMVTSIWVATNMSNASVDWVSWFARREEIMFYNLRQLMQDDDARMYLHMGAFHTNKAEGSAGSRMAHEFLPTQGRVFSVGPAYGDGSEIYYNGVLSMEAEPTIITDALAGAVQQPLFVSTSANDDACRRNPLFDEPDVDYGWPLGAAYDGYVYIERLTPETRPSDATIGRDVVPSGTHFWTLFDVVHAREREVLQPRVPIW